MEWIPQCSGEFWGETSFQQRKMCLPPEKLYIDLQFFYFLLLRGTFQTLSGSLFQMECFFVTSRNPFLPRSNRQVFAAPLSPTDSERFFFSLSFCSLIRPTSQHWTIPVRLLTTFSQTKCSLIPKQEVAPLWMNNFRRLWCRGSPANEETDYQSQPWIGAFQGECISRSVSCSLGKLQICRMECELQLVFHLISWWNHVNTGPVPLKMFPLEVHVQLEAHDWMIFQVLCVQLHISWTAPVGSRWEIPSLYLTLEVG